MGYTHIVWLVIFSLSLSYICMYIYVMYIYIYDFFLPVDMYRLSDFLLKIVHAIFFISKTPSPIKENRQSNYRKGKWYFKRCFNWQHNVPLYTQQDLSRNLVSLMVTAKPCQESYSSLNPRFFHLKFIHWSGGCIEN